MKHIKTFENIKEPQVGDYVNCKEDNIYTSNKESLYNFIYNNVGKIHIIRDKNVTYRRYVVYYDNVPDDIKDRFDDRKNGLMSRNYNDEEILFFSENKQEVEAYIQAKKYNL